MFDTVILGLGCSVTELTVETVGMRMRILLSATPTTPGVVEFTVGLALRTPSALDRLPRAALDHATAPLARFLLANVLADIEQDRAIWAHRVRLERPQLAPEDAEIAHFRRWLVQFRDDARGTVADGAT